jgi:hypothetical protein
MSYPVEHYKGTDHPKTEHIEFAEELVKRYGTSVTPEQFAKFAAEERAAFIAEAERYIASMPIFAEAGIYNYSDYEALHADPFEREYTQVESDAIWTLLGEECDYLGFRLNAIAEFEEYYGYRESDIADKGGYFYENFSEKEQARLKAQFANGEHHSVLSYWTFDVTNDYARYFSILLMLSVLILIAPLIISDRHSKVHYLQYSSKYGRKILHSQFVAVLISAFALTTILVLIFGRIFSVNGSVIFWNSYLISAFNMKDPALSITYGGWVIVMVGLMYVLALGVTTIAFIISRFSRNMIELVVKLLPVFAAMIFLCAAVFGNLFLIGNAVYQGLKIVGAEVYVSAAFAILAFAAAIFVMRRERRANVE